VLAAIFVGVGLSTLVVGLLESWLGVRDASSIYLVVVAAIAVAFGVRGAIATAVAAVLTYDFLFTEPRHTLTVSDPGEWLNLVLLLFVAVTVGQLAALQRMRARAAVMRERESSSLFEITRSLAARETTIAVLPQIASALSRDGQMNRVWFAFGSVDGEERVLAEAGGHATPLPPRAYAVLHRASPGSKYRWTLVRDPVGGRQPATMRSERHFRVRMEDSGRAVGSIWATRQRDAGEPDESETRLLRVAADLVSQALARDRLAEETRRAEIAQQSDALKSALLDSVSHDLRTPLASIRAYAGTLMDPAVPLSPAEARASAVAIDDQAQRLNRLVGNLLDLSRIESGALRVASDALDLEDVVARGIALIEARAGNRTIEVDVPSGAAVLADPVLLEEALHNLLDNAISHTPDGSTIRITSSAAGGDELLRLTVEDSGAGVPDAALERIFDKFYRTSQGSGRGRAGTGIGLAVVRGFVEVMGGRVTARRGALGGLAIDIDMPVAHLPVAVRPVE
jgi:two-component system sensor histidine kinase KdpD